MTKRLIAEHPRTSPLKRKARQDLIITALAVYGQITGACGAVGVPIRTYTDWLKVPEFRARVEAATAKHADRMESKLFDIIDAIDPKKPPNPAYMLGTMNALKPEKYRQTVIDTSSVAKDVMAEFRKAKKEWREGKAMKADREDKEDRAEGARELLERIKAQRSR